MLSSLVSCISMRLPVAGCQLSVCRESPVGSCLMPALVLVRHYLTQLNWTLVAKLSWQLPLVCLCVSRLQCNAAKCLPLPQQLASDPPHAQLIHLITPLSLSFSNCPILLFRLCVDFAAPSLLLITWPCIKLKRWAAPVIACPRPCPCPRSCPRPHPSPCHAHALRVYPRYVVVLFTQLLTAWRCHDYKYATDVTADVVS